MIYETKNLTLEEVNELYGTPSYWIVLNLSMLLDLWHLLITSALQRRQVAHGRAKASGLPLRGRDVERAASRGQSVADIRDQQVRRRSEVGEYEKPGVY